MSSLSWKFWVFLLLMMSMVKKSFMLFFSFRKKVMCLHRASCCSVWQLDSICCLVSLLFQGGNCWQFELLDPPEQV